MNTNNGWLDIASAPKTGRTLLLGYWNSHGKWRTVCGQWMSAEYIGQEWEEPDDVEAGWFETAVEADDVPNCWPVNPSHWQPMPTPPCPTCKDQGAVGNILNAQPCPDCPPPASAQPESQREGYPHEDPRFVALCREHDILGTAMQGLAAVFWREGGSPAPSAPGDAQDERQAFEAWAKTQADTWLLVGGLQWSPGTNDYASTRTNAAWEAWKERASIAAPAAGDALDAQRWRFIRRKLCLTGNGDGTCAIHAINLPASVPGWPEPGPAVAEFCDAAIDAEISSQQGEGGAA